MISIVDCGMGNLGSVRNMLKHIGADAEIISTPEQILAAEKLILPGVGHWNHGAKQLAASDLRTALEEKVLQQKTPILGICLGMQLLFEESEEGDAPGLGWIAGKVIRFDMRLTKQRLRVPHMGWNRVFACRETSLTAALPEEPRFYFVHSYHVRCSDSANALMTCKYGAEFVCAVNKDNIWGVQFHPEKSHKFGMSLMRWFAEL